MQNAQEVSVNIDAAKTINGLCIRKHELKIQ